jgi:hypothetical protein
MGNFCFKALVIAADLSKDATEKRKGGDSEIMEFLFIYKRF